MNFQDKVKNFLYSKAQAAKNFFEQPQPVQQTPVSGFRNILNQGAQAVTNFINQAPSAIGTAGMKNLTFQPGTSAYQMAQPVRDLVPLVSSFPMYQPLKRSAETIKEYVAPKGGYTSNDTSKLINAAKAAPSFVLNAYGSAFPNPAVVATSAGFGAVTNPRNPVQGAFNALESAPAISSVGAMTNPIIDKVGFSIGSKFASPISSFTARGATRGLAQIPEGIAMKGAISGQPYDLADAGWDFATGFIPGSGGGVKGKGFNNSKPGMNEVDIKQVSEIYRRVKELGYKTAEGKVDLDTFGKDRDYIEEVFKDYIGKRKEDLQKPFEEKLNMLFDQARYDFRNRTPAMNLYGGENAQSGKPNFSSLADKKPRFEIDDSGAKLKLPWENDPDFDFDRKLFSLDEILDHPKLFKEYPELKDVAVQFEDGLGGGAYNPKINRITLSSPDNAKSILLHEIQHAIQEKEGFARGGSPSQFDDLSNNTNIKDLFERQWEYVSKLDKNSPQWEGANDELQKLARQLDSPEQQYKRLSGEVEARDVQARMNMTSEQRRTSQPYASQGIPVKDQIVRFDGGISASLSPKQQSLKKLPGIMYSTNKKVAEGYDPRPSVTIKNKIKELKVKGSEILDQEKAHAEYIKSRLSPYGSSELKDIARIKKMASSKAVQEGDFETLFNKNPKLVSQTLQVIQQHNPGRFETDQEAYQELLSLPKKSDAYIHKPTEFEQIKELKNIMKTVRDDVYHYEPNKFRQQAIMRNNEYKEWAASVYKDAATSEKETLKRNTDTIVNAIKGSFDEVKPTPKQKIGVFDLFRTPDRVLQKIGLGGEAKILRRQYEKYLKELPIEIDKVTQWSKRVSPESNQKIFKYLDGRIPNTELKPEELKVANEIQGYLSNWADKLNLPKEKRIANYITHIFERDLIEKEFDPDFAKMIRDKVPGSVYDPFLEKRLGKLGYKEDTWSALDAYIKRATRKYNMDPALKRVKDKAQYLEESQYDYVKNYIDRINLRPTKWDNILDNTFKQIFGYTYGARPTNAITRQMRQQVYRATLGLNIGSAMRNLTQGANTYAKLGEKYTILGYTNLLKNTLSGSDELERVGILKDDMIQDRTINATKKFWENTDKGLFAFFNIAEKINRGSAYYGAKSKALAQGMSEEKAIEYAKKLVRDTQFAFGSIDSPAILNSDIVKTVGQFQSYNVKQTEFLAEMVKNKEYAGLARWAGASLGMVYTIGQIMGWEPTDLIPFYDHMAAAYSSLTGNPYDKDYKRVPQPPFMTVARGSLAVPTLLGGDETKKAQAWKDVKSAAALTIPAGSQIKKTLEGLRDVGRGYSESLKGQVQYPIAQKTSNYVRAGLFGKSTLDETKQYYKNNESVLGKKQSQLLKGSEDKMGTYDLLMKQRRVNKVKNILSDIKNGEKSKDRGMLEINKIMSELGRKTDEPQQISKQGFFDFSLPDKTEAKPTKSRSDLEIEIQDSLIKSKLELSDKEYEQSADGKYFYKKGESIKTVDLSKPIDIPKLSDSADINKELIKDFKSEISSRINSIVDLYKVGAMSQEEAQKKINELKSQTGGSKKKKKSLGSIEFKLPKLKTKRITLKSPTVKPPKLPELRSNLKPLKYKGKSFKLKRPNL